MISVVRHNCIGFINENSGDTRAKMLVPLALLTNPMAMENEDKGSIPYKKACDLFSYLTKASFISKYSRYNLLASELELKYDKGKFSSYGLLSREELEFIIDFIDCYGGFRVFSDNKS